MIRGTDSRRQTSPPRGGQSGPAHVADDFRPLASYFKALLTKISIADDAYDAAIERATRYARSLENDREFGVVGSRIGGSIGKGTAIAPLSDVDLYLYLDANHWSTRGRPLQPGTVIGRLSARLHQRLDFEVRNGHVRLRRQTHSVGIRFHKEGSVGIDVVPAIVSPRDITEAFIPRRGTDGYVETSVERQLQIMDDWDTRFRYLRRGIRLLKFWNRQQEAPLPSYAMEILGLHAVAGGCTHTELAVFITALDFIARTNMREPVFVQHFFRYSPPRRRACVILDPAMPNNDVTEHLRAEDGDRLGVAARFTLVKLRKAIRFLQQGHAEVAADCLSEAFGQDGLFRCLK